MIDEPWHAMLTDAQRGLLNAACGDLARQLPWHGMRLDKDDYRHMIAGTVLGWRTFPGIVDEHGRSGWIMLGGSSLKLTREQCSLAIDLAFAIGDDPQGQHLDHAPVDWCDKVRLARGLPLPGDASEAEFLSGRYAA
ncbi:MAG TPA: recombination protein NinB [Rhodanobacteraceae bacterium]|nr:recombination protein NinB [Rhodanobacteraceae bacterium]